MDPRLTGVPHGQLSSAQARRDTQMFWSKTPSSGRSGRVEAKNMVSPSLDSAACWSLNDVLIVGPRFTGSDQAENCGALSAASDARPAAPTARPGAPVESTRQPTRASATADRTARGTSEKSLRVRTVLIPT